MPQIRYTRNLILRCICAIYIFAFASLYIQLPGLFGDNGILPARAQLEADDNLDLAKKIHRKPTLLWLAPYIGLSTEYMMDVIALFGIFLAFTGFVSQKFCCKPNFFALWSLYFSLFQVGQTFLQFYWDTLLLEVGFLCIILAPFGMNKDSFRKGSAPSDPIKLWLFQWLLFRLVFTTPINKLSSGDASWWNLSALSIHFQSMPLPSPLAWNSYHLPAWFLKFTTAFSLGTELLIPPMFLLPFKFARRIAFYFIGFLQLTIIATGNYNFFNFLILAVSLSLLDDSYFISTQNKKSNKMISILSVVASLVVFGFVLFAFYKLFGLQYNQKTNTVLSKITFTKAQYDTYLGEGLIGSIYLGLASFVLTCIIALYNTFKSPGKLGKLSSLVVTTFYIVTCLLVFSLNTVPLANLHPAVNKTVHPAIKQWHGQLSHLHISNAYGLFRTMTGVDGRPEVVLEGSYSREGPWKEISFKYKPGDVNRTLPFVAPHQPRLDWQMWFAALSTYHQNPWISSLAYRILTNQKEVLDLLDMSDYSFKVKPPTYIRAYSYKYLYTPKNTKSTAWWTRSRQEEYFPEFEAKHEPLIAYLTQFGILKKRKPEQIHPTVKDVLDKIRKSIVSVEPVVLMWSLIFTGLVLIYLRGPKTPPPSSTPKPKRQPQPNQSTGSKSKPKKK